MLFVVIIAGAGYYYYHKYRTIVIPQERAAQEAQDVVMLVAQLMVLPEGETPTVATISNPEQLKDQPFFANAKKGDRVLIYTQASKAILYDPVAHKIVNVAPLNLNSMPQ